MVKKIFGCDDMKIAVIGDEDMVSGFLLAGTGSRAPGTQPNFLIVDSKTKTSDIDAAFTNFTTRKDIGIVLMGQSSADLIRPTVNAFAALGSLIPVVMEVPNAGKAYDPKNDPVMQRVQVFFAGNLSV